MAKHLHDLEAAEVSIVKRGANKRKFLVLKSADGGDSTVKKLMKMLMGADKNAMAKVAKAVEGMGGTEPGAGIDDRAQQALKAVGRILEPFKDQITDDMVDQVLSEIGIQCDDGGGMGGEEDGTADGDVAKAHMEAMKEWAIPEKIKSIHHTEAMKSAMGAYKSAVEKLGYAMYPSPQPDMTNKGADGADKGGDVEKQAIMKSDGTLNLEAVPAEVRPAVELIYKAQVAEKNRADSLAAELKKERDTRREKEFVAKADSFTHFSGDKAKLAKDLMALQDASQAAYDTMISNLELVEKQAKQIDQDIFREIGTGRAGITGGDAYAKIEALADGMVQKSTDGLTRDAAIQKVLGTTEGKKLYAEYKSTREKGV